MGLLSECMESLRILVIDEHALVRAALRLLLDMEPDYVVVGEVGPDEDSVEIARREAPDIILFDPLNNMEHASQLLSALREATPRSHVLILTNQTDPRLHLHLMVSGVRGIVFKNQSTEVLFRAIERVADGEIWLDPAIMQNALSSSGAGAGSSERDEEDKERAKQLSLTSRERELIALLCQGFKNDDIARRLFVSEKTVRNCLSVVYAKVEVRNRLELVFYGIRQGLAIPRDDS